MKKAIRIDLVQGSQNYMKIICLISNDTKYYNQLEMWVNAQRDGRPPVYLFIARQSHNASPYCWDM